MNMKDEDIFDILDGIASEEIIGQHHKMLAESADYQAVFSEYTQTHALLMNTCMEKTAFNFTDKLIDRWEGSPAIVVIGESSKLPIYFLIGGIIMLTILITLTLPLISQSTIQIDLSKFLKIVQDKILVRSVLIINVLLALFLIDKRLLKPYFQRRMGI